MIYFISLGSNLGDKKQNLIQAVSSLRENGVKIGKCSSYYQTAPVGPVAQSWFLNQVIKVESDLSPHSFLRLIKNIERKLGRQKSISKGPRHLDIDILLAEDKIIQTKELIIPHPQMDKRNFVLIPLREIAPDTVHPVLNKTIHELWQNSPDRSEVKIFSFR